MGELNSTSILISLRHIPQKDLDEVLEGLSKHFNLISVDIRKRGVS